MGELQKPSVGRIVHYVAYGTISDGFKLCPHRAAIITQVHSDSCVDLCIINPTGLLCATSALLDDGEQVEGAPAPRTLPGSWHWPERV